LKETFVAFETLYNIKDLENGILKNCSAVEIFLDRNFSI